MDWERSERIRKEAIERSLSRKGKLAMVADVLIVVMFVGLAVAYVATQVLDSMGVKPEVLITR